MWTRRDGAAWVALIVCTLRLLHRCCAADGPYTPSSGFSSTACNVTFSSFDAAFVGSWTAGPLNVSDYTVNYIPQLPFQSIAALCPPGCVAAAGSGRVYGSFPYHGRSSVCLAAIHSGIIDASTGGGVFVSRFWRQDWSNSSTQSIFPFSSGGGSLSNGVQSAAVDGSWYTVPSSANEWSYVTRGRGDRILQRRKAPFPKRAGHVQHMWYGPEWAAPDGVNSYLLHLVAAGYNSTHYLNGQITQPLLAAQRCTQCQRQQTYAALCCADVWLGVQRVGVSPADVSWSRQVDAPFTPRSHLQLRAASSLMSDPIMYVVGGQTSHSCGLRELGVCSDEVWRFRLTPDDSGPEPVWRVSWDPEPLLRLPFTPRCQPAMFTTQYTRLQGPPVQGLTFVGGQLSFDSSKSCSQQPETVSEFWYGNFTLEAASQAQWWRLPDMPFSPRRFEWSNPWPYGWRQVVRDAPWTSGYMVGELTGGLRHVSTTLAAPGVALLNQTDITAEIWHCEVGDGIGPDAPPLPFLKAGMAAMAAPTAAWADHLGPDNLSPAYGLSFGGITSDGFIRAWRNALPPLDADISADYRTLAINITMVQNPQFSSYSGYSGDRIRLRANLPLSLTMNAAELADPSGNYALGSEWTQAIPSNPPHMSSLSTFHHQAFAFAAGPGDASLFVPQAASSINTTRPLFNFSLRRHSHRYARYHDSSYCRCGEPDGCSSRRSLCVTSGGRSGDDFFDDWISTHLMRCLPPVDPSFRDVLGPIRVVDTQTPSYSAMFTVTGSVDPGATVRVRCPLGHHFEPPLMASGATLSCVANGMWMDVEALTIRRCVPNVLHCSSPLADLGGVDCEPALPIISRLSAAFMDRNQQMQSMRNVDDVTVVDVPVGTAVQLCIDGNVFVHPVAVSVDGKQCEEVRLLMPGGGPGRLCYNLSSEGDGEHNVTVQLRCDDYGSRITCTLPPVLGRQMIVTVSSGRFGAVVEVDPAVGRDTASLSSMAPVLTSIRSPAGDCQHDASLLQLTGCPVNSSFHIEVCALDISVGDGQGVVATMASNSYLYPLDCSEWSGRDSPPCMTCQMFPRLSTARITLRHDGIGLDGKTAALLSFLQCEAGSSTNVAAALQGNASHLCSPCLPGWSTDNIVGLDACIPCLAGFYSSHIGAAACSRCPAGSYAESSNCTACLPCSPNSYARYTAQVRCSACELNQYLVYAPQQTRVAGECRDCPAMAQCDRLGNITAQARSYVLIDQSSGTLSTAACWSSTCLDGQQCSDSSSAPAQQRVALSNLTVINCCAPGAWPAYVAEPELYRDDAVMQASHGHNVLCASCLPGFASANGRCIDCGSTRVGALVGVLLLALLLVYAVHRLPHDWTGSARLLITSYFLQMAALFQATEALPPLFSLLNVSLLGSHVSRGQDTAVDLSQRATGYAGVCIVPLSDAGRLTMALLSPLIAFAMLAMVAALQLAARAALSRSQLPSSAAAHRWYRWLFVPSPPKLVEPGDWPAVGHHSGQQHSQRVSLLQEPSTGAVADCSSSVQRQETDSVWQLSLLYQRSCVRLLQLSYSGLTLLTLSFFLLQSVGEFGWRVVEYPTVSPQSAEYRMMLPFVACVLAVVVCGLPLALTAFLLVEHRRGSIEEAKLQQSAGRVIVSRKAALLLQLCAAFGPQYWWMAPFVLVRRLLLVALLVSVRDAEVWAWLTLVNFCLLALHLKLEPYQRSRDNALEALTLLSLSVQTTVLIVWPPPYLALAVLTLLNTLIIAPLLPLLVNASSRVWRTCRSAGQPLSHSLLPHDNCL